MKLAAPLLAFAGLLVLGGCPAPEERETPRVPERPAPTQPADPTQSSEPAAPSQPQVSDQQIEQQLTQQIHQDQSLSPAAHQGVMIEVRNGVVTLRGQVESQNESQRIEDMALLMEGVQDVDNQLQVTMELDDDLGEPDDPFADPS